MPDPEDPAIGPPADDEPDAAAAASAAALRRVTRSTGRAKPKSTRPSPASFSNDRDPQGFGASVDRLMREQGWQDRSAVAVLVSEWAQIVGADLAEHVVPIGFDDGVLTLQAESTTWATQVRLLLPSLHRTVDERVGSGVVTRITIMGPQAPSWKAGPRVVKGRGPRDTYG